METHPKDRRAYIELMALLILITALSGCGQQPAVPGYTSKVQDPYAAKRWSSPQFTTAHRTYGDALKHFLNIQPAPEQPLDFPHNIHHVNEIGMACAECHSGVTKGARAGLPSVDFCMSCHEDIGDPSDSRIQMLRDHAKRGEDIPWQRVYGFLEESHVRFNHAPHIRAGVDCIMCHGDVTQGTVAKREIEHTMGFCVNCHQQRGASNDCLTCHF